MSTLAIYSGPGCPEALPSGNIGQVLIQQASAPAWGGANNIALADIGNYFISDNVESALQQLAAAVGAGPGGGGGGVVATFGAIMGAGTAPSPIILRLNNLGLATGPLDPSIKFVMANDPTNIEGSRASVTDVSNLLSIFSTTDLRTLPGATTVPLIPTTTIAICDDGINFAGARARAEDVANLLAPYIVIGGDAIQDAIGFLFGAGDGLTYDDPGNRIYFSGGTLPAVGGLPPGLTFIVANDGVHSEGTQATIAQVVAVLDPYFAGHRPWAAFGGAGTPTSRSNVEVADTIYHTGKMRRGQITSFTTGAPEFESLGNAAIGNANTVTTGNTALVAGTGNVATGNYSFVAGINNQGRSAHNTVTGDTNRITDTLSGDAIILGGDTNTLSSSPDSGIVISTNSTMTGSQGLIAGATLATMSACFGGLIIGGSSQHMANAAGGVIVGGEGNDVSQPYGFATGVECDINHLNAFMFNSALGGPFASADDGEFAVSAHGGFRFRSNFAHTVGVDLPSGANSWSSVSAAALKGDFKQVDPRSILSRLIEVPIDAYRFKRSRYDKEAKALVEDGHYDHINFGPTAEAWNTAFGDLFGEKTVTNANASGELEQTPAISDGDKLGVALAAIQGLFAVVEELKGEVKALKGKLTKSTKA